MSSALFDSSIYICAMRRGDEAILSLRRLSADAPLWLSAVVLEELYAGVLGRGLRIVERMEQDFAGVRRILTPNLSDWIVAGKVIARLADKYDYEQVGRGRLTNDALIAMSAGRQGIRVITTNQRDFQRLAEFRPVQWELATL